MRLVSKEKRLTQLQVPEGMSEVEYKNLSHYERAKARCYAPRKKRLQQGNESASYRPINEMMDEEDNASNQSINHEIENEERLQDEIDAIEYIASELHPAATIYPEQQHLTGSTEKLWQQLPQTWANACKYYNTNIWHCNDISKSDQRDDRSYMMQIKEDKLLTIYEVQHGLAINERPGNWECCLDTQTNTIDEQLLFVQFKQEHHTCQICIENEDENLPPGYFIVTNQCAKEKTAVKYKKVKRSINGHLIAPLSFINIMKGIHTEKYVLEPESEDDMHLLKHDDASDSDTSQGGTETEPECEFMEQMEAIMIGEYRPSCILKNACSINQINFKVKTPKHN